MADFDNGKENDEKVEEEAPVRVFDWMPVGCQALADGEYDAIVMGTGTFPLLSYTRIHSTYSFNHSFAQLLMNRPY